MMQARTLLVVLMSATAVSAKASDIAIDVRQNTVDSENGGFTEVGIGYEYDSGLLATASGEADKSSFVINLGGAYFYKGFFIEGAMETYEGLNFGYQLASNQNGSIDFIASSLTGTLKIGDDDEELSADEQLIERDSFYNGAGIRLTRYVGDNVIQGRLVSDVFKGNGLRASVRLGRNWQMRNWNLHSIASVDYTSAKTMEYVLGITEEEQTERFSAYHPEAGSSFSLEFGSAYPISEHLVWNTRLLLSQYSDEISNSPLITDDHQVIARSTLNYVF